VKLTREQRKLLFDGEPVKIAFPGDKPCPIKVGHVEHLSPNVWFEVTDLRRAKTGEHVLVYTLFNNRLGQRFLATQDGQKHPEQYDYSGGSGVDYEAGEAVDAFTQRKFTRDARKRELEATGELLAALEDLRAAVKERLEMNPEAIAIMGRDAWALRSKIDSIERRLKRRQAA